MTKALVIIPTYNEVENIADMVHAVMALPDGLHMLVIDDNSADGTAQIVENLKIQYSDRLFLIKRSGKLGLGTAYIMGFKYALEKNYDHILEMDADFSHDPADLSRLLHTCRHHADVAIGSRYVKGGKVENWPSNRIFISKGASIYVRLITQMPVHDTTAGFVCYNRNVLESIDLDKITFIGYAFQIEMKFAAWRCGYKLREIPITFKDREKGASKMSKGIVREAVLGVLKIKWNSFFRNYKKNQK